MNLISIVYKCSSTQKLNTPLYSTEPAQQQAAQNTMCDRLNTGLTFITCTRTQLQVNANVAPCLLDVQQSQMSVLCCASCCNACKCPEEIDERSNVSQQHMWTVGLQLTIHVIRKSVDYSQDKSINRLTSKCHKKWCLQIACLHFLSLMTNGSSKREKLEPANVSHLCLKKDTKWFIDYQNSWDWFYFIRLTN